MGKKAFSNSRMAGDSTASTDAHSAHTLRLLTDEMKQSNRMHQTFLDSQAQALKLLSPDKNAHQDHPTHHKSTRSVFTKAQLQEFGSGSIAKCFGPDYAVLDQRISPRIPNGELLMIDRVTAISGVPKDLKAPASITTEVDIPSGAWFLSENVYPGLPLSILMEMAMQPCGILSAYLGTSLMLPEKNNRFRNLDGKIHFFNNPAPSETTITNRSVLRDTITSGGMHIQKYAFWLSSGAAPFLQGEASFGYFTDRAMQQQTGLSPLHPEDESFASSTKIPLPQGRSGSAHLNLIDTLIYAPADEERHAVIFGKKALSENAWFYKNHFYQDPVMPGSLGAEAIVQGLWAFLEESGHLRSFKDPVLSFSQANPLTWKYRGQVTPDNRKIQFEVTIKDEQLSPSQLILSADADFWVDGLHIYAFKNIGIIIAEKQFHKGN